MNTPWSQTAANAIALADLLSQRGFAVRTVTHDSVHASIVDRTVFKAARDVAAELGAPIVTGNVSTVLASRECWFSHNGVDVYWDEPITVTVTEQVPA